MRFARLAGLLLVGCGGIARVDGSDPMSPKELVDPLFEAFAEDPAESLPITGPVNLDVDIFRGDVLVRRAEGLDSPRLITTRRADFGAGRSEDGYLALDDVQIKARLESGPEGPVLVIKASSGHPDAAKCEPISSLSFPSPVGYAFVPDLATSKSEAALVPLIANQRRQRAGAPTALCKVT